MTRKIDNGDDVKRYLLASKLLHLKLHSFGHSVELSEILPFLFTLGKPTNGFLEPLKLFNDLLAAKTIYNIFDKPFINVDTSLTGI